MTAKVVELIDVQLLNGQECLTRFHYLDADGVASESVLVSDYINDVLPLVVPFQSSITRHVSIRHRQVYPTALLVQETAISPAVAGLSAAAPGPDHASISLKFGIGDTTYLAGGLPPHVRKGGKHLPGVTMAYMDEDALTDAGFDALVATWFTEVKDPGTDPWQLVVASFEVTGQHLIKTPGQRIITKAVVSPTITKYAPVLTVSPASISTQNTRKKLRGRTY